LIPTFSPQGDGNAVREEVIPDKTQCVVDPYLFPARGRKLRDVHVFGHVSVTLIPTFSPQGDGNLGIRVACCSAVLVDPYLFPARGRKHSMVPVDLGTSRAVDPYFFPARGRKPELREARGERKES